MKKQIEIENQIETNLKALEVPLLDQKVEPVQSTELADNPVKGILFFIANTIFMVMTNTMSAQQFKITPTLTVFEALFARGVVSIVILMLYMNRRVKTELYDSVDTSNLKALIFRCGSGCLV